MEQISRIGMDTSKRFFQLHGVSAAETVVLRKKLRRKEMVGFFEKLAPTVVGIEACGASHHWARLLQSFGHTVTLIPAQLVKPYVKRGKNDMADAEALCEAMSRPTMRFVPIKTAEQQAALMLVGLRDRLIRNRTQLSNAIRGYTAEFGFAAAKAVANLRPLLERIEVDEDVPDLAREPFAAQAEEYAQLDEQIAEISAKLMAWHKADECSRRLAKIPGIGPIGAALLIMKTPAPELFRSGRQFAAALLKEADSSVGDEAGFLVIDDTALPKKGCHSVGVAPQYASSLGKTANCQSLVSVTLASREVPVMVGLRLFLPESWTDDSERMARAGVPKDRQTPLTKPEIAVEEVDRVIASGARFGCVLADSGYGSSGPFRRALSERGLLWAAGLSRRQNVYPADVTLIFPVAKSGKPRKYHIPDQPPVSAEVLLAVEKWQRVSWRRGTEGRLTCLFAARRSALWMVISTGCATIVCSACREMKSGSSANAGRLASKNTMSRTYRPTRASRCSPPRSKPDGSVSRRISNSRKSSVSTTSKADPGPGYIDTP
ncbi:IS110 family transposase [Bradyrhizobium liaoningense]|uniref:IS110 family transposase n=1 Tax=Bradyrhizobium liaoningense TaxID=43992 RepID=UPI003908AE6F